MIAKVNRYDTFNSSQVIVEAVKLSSILTVSSPSSTMAVSTLTASVSTIMMSPGVPPRLTVLVTTMDSGMIVDQVVLHHPQQQPQGPHQPAAQTLAQVHARQHQVLVLWDHLVSSLSPTMVRPMKSALVWTIVGCCGVLPWWIWWGDIFRVSGVTALISAPVRRFKPQTMNKISFFSHVQLI